MSKCKRKDGLLYNFEDIALKTDEYIKAYTRMGYFSGSVLIAQGDKIILNKGYGMANLEHGIPNTPSTKFRIASITKPFIAMAIVQLHEKKMLDVNNSIDMYFPGYPSGDRITIHHLLTHTSGIVNFTSTPEVAGILRKHTRVEEIIDIFRNKPLEFGPGMKYSYSNSGYVLLSQIIEKVSGMPYEMYLKENIFSRLGMKNTGRDNYEEILRNRAAGYTVSGSGIVNTDFIDTSILCGWACLYSTVEDLYLWDRALYTEKLAGRCSLDTMFIPFISCGKSSYGYGWFIDEKQIHHGGWINGFCTNIARYIGWDAIIIILSNNDLASMGNIISGLEAIVFGKKYELPEDRAAIEAQPERYDSYIGTYRDTENNVFTIAREGGRLFIEYREIIRNMRLELYPAHEGQDSSTYFTRVLDLIVVFSKDGKGNVRQAVLHRNGNKLKLKKHTK